MLGARRLPNEPTMPPKVGDTWQKWGGRTLTSLIEHVGGLEVFDKIFARIDARDPSPGHVWFAGKEGKLAIKPTSEEIRCYQESLLGSLVNNQRFPKERIAEVLSSTSVHELSLKLLTMPVPREWVVYEERQFVASDKTEQESTHLRRMLSTFYVNSETDLILFRRPTAPDLVQGLFDEVQKKLQDPDQPGCIIRSDAIDAEEVEKTAFEERRKYRSKARFQGPCSLAFAPAILGPYQARSAGSQKREICDKLIRTMYGNTTVWPFYPQAITQKMIEEGTWWLPSPPRQLDPNVIPFPCTLPHVECRIRHMPRITTAMTKLSPYEFARRLRAELQEDDNTEFDTVIDGECAWACQDYDPLTPAQLEFFATYTPNLKVDNDIDGKTAMVTSIDGESVWDLLSQDAILNDVLTPAQERLIDYRRKRGPLGPKQRARRVQDIAQRLSRRHNMPVSTPPPAFFESYIVVCDGKTSQNYFATMKKAADERHNTLAEVGALFCIYPTNRRWEDAGFDSAQLWSQATSAHKRRAENRRRELDTYFTMPCSDRKKLRRGQKMTIAKHVDGVAWEDCLHHDVLAGNWLISPLRTEFGATTRVLIPHRVDCFRPLVARYSQMTLTHLHNLRDGTVYAPRHVEYVRACAVKALEIEFVDADPPRTLDYSNTQFKLWGVIVLPIDWRAEPANVTRYATMTTA